MQPASAMESIDYGEALRKIEAFRPKVLNITGGEPTLVDQLPWILKESKTRWNPFTRVVSNGTNIRILDQCLPYLDKLVVSLDGIGTLNRQSKGIDGDLIIRRIRHVSERLAETPDARCKIWVNCTVATHNCLQIGDLVARLVAISPEILICLSPLMPADDPASLMMHSDLWDQFWSFYHQLRASHPNVFEHFEHLRTRAPLPSVRCYARCFWVAFDPWGNAHACPPVYSEATDQCDFDCRTPCNCEGWLDFFLSGEHCDSTAAFLSQFAGRFTAEEQEEGFQLIVRYINPGFKRRDLEAFGGRVGRWRGPGFE
jgi:MoaA/NifB/PqqE/SkfB family radical SAM enzyme